MHGSDWQCQHERITKLKCVIFHLDNVFACGSTQQLASDRGQVMSQKRLFSIFPSPNEKHRQVHFSWHVGRNKDANMSKLVLLCETVLTMMKKHLGQNTNAG